MRELLKAVVLNQVSYSGDGEPLDRPGDTAEVTQLQQAALPARPLLSRAEVLDDLRNSFRRIWTPDNAEYQAVADLLQEREKLLQLAHPYFRDTANQVVKIVKQRADGVVQRDALDLEIDGALRSQLVGLLNSVPQPLKDLWLGLPVGTDRSDRLLQLSQVFYWSLSRMIEFAIDADSKTVPRIEVRNRGTVAGEPSPYALHTCVDVPFAVSHVLGLRSTDPWMAALQLALEWAHDTKEVGKQLHWVEGRFTEGRIVLDDLETQLPLRRLGQKLAIGVELLTESEFDEIYQYDMSAHDRYVQEVAPIVEQCRRDYQLETDPWLTKILLRDPFVFGGLALQVNLGSKILLRHDPVVRASGLTAAGARGLAEAICTTEPGDRIADMATLERHIEQHKDDLGLMRFKILAYCSRMLNMYEKLNDAIESLDQAVQPTMQRAMRIYLAVLAVKFDQMNQEIPYSTKRIDRRELLRFYESVFVPIQSAADRTIEPFIHDKIRNVLLGSSSAAAKGEP